MIATWIMSGLWGLLAGSALLVGAIFGYFFKIPQRIVASIMAFGAGVLMSAISFELLDEAYALGGAYHVVAGFLIGATIFTLANVYLARKGAKHRKRSGKAILSENGFESSGPAIAVGSVLDGIPESIAIGLTMIEGGIVSTATVVAIFLSNIPEGLSSSTGMKTMGWRAVPIFVLWTVITLCTGVSSLAGYTIFSHFSPGIIAAVLALAAGGILAMLVDTMIPEAFSETHNLAGMVTVLGFILSFILSKFG
ncbi:ZIP family metal transporter [Methanobacterium paludis]|uniref:Zinc/iron permease n=1 Tax=Methanobacterium paludis (strain DSM 25820 / JCM 18151 / SWAN1) TaxID=868131 RepID=F6D7V4_METPW|nr:zinc/iron permease [Methanobacterium paludis]AEG17792.1 zinc/iron permease [Methanobacterium paludis]